MVQAMSHGGGRSKQEEEGSCTTSVSLGMYLRCAFRKASGRPKRIKEKPARPRAEEADGVSVSVELMSSSSSASARKESVVRVVLSSGVVEVYPGVVLACTVIRKHPPGLCLAHPDVFRNPHGARVRPLELLFPGHKFLLLPESTIEKLQRNIPEGSVGAFHFHDDDDHEDDGRGGSEEAVTTSSEEEMTADDAVGRHSGGSGTGVCSSAREYFEARERWAEDQFRRMVERGLAGEHSAEPLERKKKKKRKDPGAAALTGTGTGCRASFSCSGVMVTARKTWEPSLPAVEEKEEDLEPPPSAG